MSAKPQTTAATLVMVALVAIAATLLLVASGGSDGGAAASGPDNVVDNGGSIEIATADFPTGRDTDEVSATGAKPVQPCRLVSKGEAEAILGEGVTLTERPQGPTCVYSGSGREIDMVIEKVPLKALKAAARSVEAVSIAGRRGWCLRYQASSVVIGIGAGRVLQVTGACQAGVRFAAAAIPRIHHR